MEIEEVHDPGTLRAGTDNQYVFLDPDHERFDTRAYRCSKKKVTGFGPGLGPSSESNSITLHHTHYLS